MHLYALDEHIKLLKNIRNKKRKRKCLLKLVVHLDYSVRNRIQLHSSSLSVFMERDWARPGVKTDLYEAYHFAVTIESSFK